MIREILPEAVFDCMIYLQALVNEQGPATACVKSVAEGRVLLLYSDEIVAELRDVLFRPKLQQKFPRLTTDRAEALIQLLLEKGIPVRNVPPEFVYERDPKDEKYVNLAIAAGADYIVSRDNDLLDLMDENRPEGQDFQARFPTLSILDPVAFLRRVAPHSDPAAP